MNEAQILLKKHFGYENFRPGQEKIISHILNGEDCLGIMPTGAGKSICYQIPALIFSGVTIVISPLIDEFKYFFISLESLYLASRCIILQMAASIVMSYPLDTP